MELLKGIDHLNKTIPYAVVTIGNFDGVHLGHRQIMTEVIARARANKGTAVVYTFRPHPQEALHPGSPVQLLSTYEEKLEILESLGIDLVVEEPFGPDFFSLTPERFFNEVLISKFHAHEIVVGHDFAFGKGRGGDLTALEAFCKSVKIPMTVVPGLTVGHEIVSSTLIRKHLLACEIEEANRLLGRPFSYRGVVVRGDARGSKLGFPTANLKIEVAPGRAGNAPGRASNKLALPHGVYVTVSKIGSGAEARVYPSVTNVGTRPTFQINPLDQPPVVVETHVLDQTLDFYGQQMEVCFRKHLRAEKKFSGIEELKAQIAQDIVQARDLLHSMTE